MSEQTINIIGFLILIIAYAIGVLIVIKKQKGEIDVLQRQVNSQSDALNNLKDFMSIFDVEKVKKYVKLIEESYTLEKEKSIREAERQIKAEAKQNVDFWVKETLSLYGAITQFTFAFPYHPGLEMAIKEMKHSVSKELLMDDLHKRREERKAIGIKEGGWMTQFMLNNPWLYMTSAGWKSYNTMPDHGPHAAVHTDVKKDDPDILKDSGEDSG